MAALKIKISENRATKRKLSFFDNNPEGISLMAVRWFLRSISASTILLNPMAADLAPTMAIKIQKKSKMAGE